MEMRSTNSISNEMLSPCEIKPFYLAVTHFHCKRSVFGSVYSTIASFLSSKGKNVQFAYKEEEQMFWCRQYVSGEPREDHVNCFWDPASHDHIVEVRRVSGGSHGFDNNWCDIFRELQAHFLGSCSEPPSSSWRRTTPFPPHGLPCFEATEASPLTRKVLSFNAASLAEQMGITVPAHDTSYLDTVAKLAKCKILDNRDEAGRLLCRYTERHMSSASFQDPETVVRVVQVLETLITDPFSSVVESALQCMELISLHCPAYLNGLVDSLIIVQHLQQLLLRHEQALITVVHLLDRHSTAQSFWVFHIVVRTLRQMIEQCRLRGGCDFRASEPVRLLQQLSQHTSIYCVC